MLQWIRLQHQLKLRECEIVDTRLLLSVQKKCERIINFTNSLESFSF